MEELNKDLLLKKSFIKTYYNFSRQNNEINFYLSFLSFEHLLYISSIYYFYELVNLNYDQNALINLLNILKYDSDFKSNYNKIPIELISFLYLYKKFNLQYINIEKFIFNIDQFNETDDLLDFLNNCEIFFREIVKNIFEIEIINLGKLLILEKIILNIKNDFSENKIYIPKNYHKTLIYNNNIYKKNIKNFKIREYLNFVINKKGNLFRLTIEPIFNNIIFNLIILYFQYYFDVLNSINNINEFYKLYFQKYLIINKNVIKKIILDPDIIFYKNIKININIFNLGIIMYLNLYFNYYYYKFKIKFI